MAGKIDGEMLEKLARRLFEPGLTEVPEPIRDRVFLARLRIRSGDVVLVGEGNLLENLGGLSWRLAPAAASLCLIMLLTLWWSAETRGWQPDPAEVLLWESAVSPEQAPELPAVLDAVLRYRQERD